MGSIQDLKDTSELVELYKPCSLYLKPIAKLNISVALPQLKDPTQSISNWDLMERIKKAIYPLTFSSIKVVKSTMEFVRFEAEASNREDMTKINKSLDNISLKVIGFYETLKVKVGEAKLDFPVRHDWDSFFRDAANMDELKPGERPDTIYFAQLPVKWFQDPADTAVGLPSETMLRRVFSTFGETRCVDIPVCDPLRKQMSKTGMRSAGFSYGGEVTFEGYVQFVEYISFVKAMDTLRGMKLVHVDRAGKHASSAAIKVDYDRTKHLSDRNIRRRRVEGEKLLVIEKERLAREETERRRIEEERARLDNEAFTRRRAREEKRRIRQMERKRLAEEKTMEMKIKKEERKLMLAERKLTSIRLLTELFKQIERTEKTKAVTSLETDLENLIKREKEEKVAKLQEEEDTRDRLLRKREEKLKEKMLLSSKNRRVEIVSDHEKEGREEDGDGLIEEEPILSAEDDDETEPTKKSTTKSSKKNDGDGEVNVDVDDDDNGYILEVGESPPRRPAVRSKIVSTVTHDHRSLGGGGHTASSQQYNRRRGRDDYIGDDNDDAADYGEVDAFPPRYGGHHHVRGGTRGGGDGEYSRGGPSYYSRGRGGGGRGRYFKDPFSGYRGPPMMDSSNYRGGSTRRERYEDYDRKRGADDYYNNGDDGDVPAANPRAAVGVGMRLRQDNFGNYYTDRVTGGGPPGSEGGKRKRYISQSPPPQVSGRRKRYSSQSPPPPPPHIPSVSSSYHKPRIPAVRSLPVNSLVSIDGSGSGKYSAYVPPGRNTSSSYDDHRSHRRHRSSSRSNERMSSSIRRRSPMEGGGDPYEMELADD